MYTISPPGLKAILSVNLTFSHKVVELPFNMGIESKIGGVINNFHFPSSQPKITEDLTEDPMAIIERGIANKPLAVTQQEASEATGEILAKAA